MAKVYEEIYKIVQRIPKGRVLTYGLISNMIGSRMSAQGVGWALKALGSAKNASDKTAKKEAQPTFNSSNVPWQRVVNSQGGTSTHKIAEIPPDLQRHLLESEGIKFNEEGKLDLQKHLWTEGLSGLPKVVTKKTSRLSKPKAKLASSKTDKGKKKPKGV